MEMRGASRIAGIGAYLPPQRVHSDDLMREVDCARFGIPENYISQHIGIIERRWAERSMKPSELATLASEVALRNSGVTADEIDLIVFSGITRDYEEPSTAHNVQNNLSTNRAACIDVPNACLGFMTGLVVADTFIMSGRADNVLVCTGEVPNNTVAEFLPKLRSTEDASEFKRTLGVLTVGDAGGAAVVQRSDPAIGGWQWMSTVSDGRYSELCYYARNQNGIEGQMVMDKICAVTLKRHLNLFERTKENLEWPAHDSDVIYCHQVGATPHRELLERAKLPIERAPVSYDNFGNLTSATVPVLMHLYPPNRRDKLLFFCSGSGITLFQGGMIF